MKKCDYFAELISAYIDCELNATLENELLDHVEWCDECRNTLDFYRSLRSMSSELVAKPPISVVGSVMSEVRKTRVSWKRYIPQFTTFAAAAVAIVLLSQTGVFKEYLSHFTNDEAEAPRQSMKMDVDSYVEDGATNITDDLTDITIENNAVAGSNGFAQKKAAAGEDEVIEDTSSDNDFGTEVIPEPSGKEDAQTNDAMLTGGASEAITVSEHPATVEPEVNDEPVDNQPFAAQINDPVETVNPMISRFTLTMLPASFDEDGHFNIYSPGEIAFVTVNDGFNSEALDDEQEIADLAAWLNSLDVAYDELYEYNLEPSISYFVNYIDGEMTMIVYVEETAHISYGGEWYAIDIPDEMPITTEEPLTE